MMEKIDYNPKFFMDKWVSFWKNVPYSNINIGSLKKDFVMIMPAPNITGSLHMGHGLNIILQDYLVRFHHVRGENSVWIPGTDHGGIATQKILENKLMQEGLNIDDLTKEEFCEYAQNWKSELVPKIYQQIEAMGAVPDFDHDYFTMDETRTLGVKEAFVRLYEQGDIYKKEGIVNWCPCCETALSDVETVKKAEIQNFYYLDYRLKTNNRSLSVMTARPETLFADVALAVNSKDERYTDIVGKIAIVPLTGKEIPIIAEDYVDSNYGEGVVRITPGHVPQDYHVALNKGLDILIIMDKKARLNELNRQFQGQDRFEAKVNILDSLKDDGFVFHEEIHPFGNAYCYRCDTLLEPWISNEWYLRLGNMIDPAIDLVESNEIEIMPEQHRQRYLQWLSDIKQKSVTRDSWWEGSCITAQMGYSTTTDWCVSRDLLWGQDLPVWYCSNCHTLHISVAQPSQCGECDCKSFSVESGVFDMWFSCALWPITVFGWPRNTDFIKRFFPQTMAVSGYDVVYFWVTTTIMLIHHLTGKRPYDTILLHGLICDGQGQKMSKSFGNIVDPLDVVNKYGADTLRLALLRKANVETDSVSISQGDFEASYKEIIAWWNYGVDCSRNVVADEVSAQLLNEILQIAFKHIPLNSNCIADGRYDFSAEVERAILFYRHDVFPLLGSQKDRDYQQERIYYGSWLVLMYPIIPFFAEEMWELLRYPGTITELPFFEQENMEIKNLHSSAQ